MNLKPRKRYAWAELPEAYQAAALAQLSWLAEQRLREYGEQRPLGWAAWLAPLLTWQLRDGCRVVWCDAWGLVEREGVKTNPAQRFVQLQRLPQPEPSRGR